MALLAALGLAVLSVGHGPSGAAAGVTDYSAPLYLSGASSALPAAASGQPLNGSDALLTSAGPGQPTTAPTPTVGTTAGNLIGSFSYAYTVVDPIGGETAVSPTSGTVTTVSPGKSITVSGLPTGVTVCVYRKGTAGIFRRIATLPGNSASTYLDNVADSTPDSRAILPQSQTRVISGIGTTGVGYYEFQPGIPLSTSSITSPTVASPAFTGHGWVVDAPGQVSFAAGTWTFTNSLKGQATGAGVAHLVIGMWKVNGSGAVVGSPIIDPTTTGENMTANIATPGGTTMPIGTMINSVPAISLGADEHLYVQFWRRQVSASSGTPITTLFAYDGITKIAHPTANGFPNTVALGSVAARVNTTPTLSGTFSDPDAGDTGTVTFQLCSDSACASVLQTGTAGGVANGASGTWTPTALADGTYFFRAHAQDSAGNQSGWSSSAQFIVDTVAPNAPALSTPAAAARVSTPQLTAKFSDVDPLDTDTGTLAFQLCTDPACTHVVSTSTTPSLANGANGSWTPTAADGVYFWRVRAQDVAANLSGWSTIGTFTLDTAPPSATTLTAPVDASVLNAIPQLGATFVDTDATDSGVTSFQICSDAACTIVVASGSSATLSNGGHGTWTPSSVPDGTYYARVADQDIAGNTSAWSTTRTFTLDRVAPSVPTGTGIADGTRTATTPTLSGSFADSGGGAGTVTFQICTTAACSSVVRTSTLTGIADPGNATWTPAPLADGTYSWRMRAEDAAGNPSAWSVPQSFTVDTVAPNVPTGLAPAAAARVAAPQLTATFKDVDPADSGTLIFQLCNDTSCTSVLSTTTSTTVANGATATKTPSLADGVYFWRVRAQDAAGNLSAWSTIRTLTVDTTAPSAPTLDAPADGALLAAQPTLGATFATADPSDTGSVSFQVCSDASCSTVVASGTSLTLTSGSRGAWTPPQLADGTYFARVRAQDAAGNTSAWSSASRFSLDMTAPSVPTGSGIADGTRTAAAPTLSATFADAGGGSGSVTFQLCSNASCSLIVASSTSHTLASGSAANWAPLLQDAAYFWRARAEDAAGNESAWSAVSSFTFDTTPPPVPTVPSVRPRVRSAPALTVGASSDTDRVEVELCSDPACTVVQTVGYGDRAWQAPALADGVYYWRALAQDAAGNESGWSSSASFVVDTVAPDVPSVTAAASDTRVSLLELSGAFASSDVDDSGKVGFQICTDAACTSVVTTAWTANAGVGALQHWTALGLADGTYFWRAAARDAAGNMSAWTDTHELTLDTTPPAKPTVLQTTRAKQTLTVQWKLPAAKGGITGYALFVNGKRTRTIDAAEGKLHIVLRANDKRTFAIAAIDAAGNVGARTIVAARPLVHVALKQARAKQARPAKR